MIEQCFYHWKLFLRRKLSSVAVKRASAVLLVLFLQIDLSLKCLLQSTTTLNVSRPVNEPLNCVFQAGLLLLMMKKQTKKLSVPSRTRLMMPHKFALFSLPEMAQTQQNSSSLTNACAKRSVRRVFVTSGWVLCCLSQSNRSSDGKFFFPSPGTGMARKSQIVSYQIVLLKYPIIIYLYIQFLQPCVMVSDITDKCAVDGWYSF